MCNNIVFLANGNTVYSNIVFLASGKTVCNKVVFFVSIFTCNPRRSKETCQPKKSISHHPTCTKLNTFIWYHFSVVYLVSLFSCIFGITFQSYIWYHFAVVYLVSLFSCIFGITFHLYIWYHFSVVYLVSLYS